MLAFDQVTLKRGRRPAILENFSYRFESYPLALLGPNGAGKTTLLSIAAGIIKPQAGSALLQEKSGVTYEGRRHLRRKVGLVPQVNSGMPGLTVREAVAYAGWLKGLSRRDAWELSLPALERVHLDAIASASSARLSGGESKRVAIAQALVWNPTLLLLDEATTGLDPTERLNVSHVIAELAGERPVIAATHEVDDLDETYAFVAVLAAGRIQFAGATTEFLSAADSNLPPRVRGRIAYQAALERPTQ